MRPKAKWYTFTLKFSPSSFLLPGILLLSNLQQYLTRNRTVRRTHPRESAKARSRQRSAVCVFSPLPCPPTSCGLGAGGMIAPMAKQPSFTRPRPPAAAPPETPEPRWPALLAILAVGGLYTALPPALTLGPRWLFPGVVVVFLIPTVVSHHTGRHRVNAF